MRLAVPMLLCLGLWPACASAPLMTSTALASRAQANPIAAQRDLAGEELRVRGVVGQSTLASRASVEVSGVGYGWYAGTATERLEQLAVVVLQPGSVLCYFEPDHIDEAADIQEGMSVDLECRVHSFRPDGPRVLSVLQGCRRASPP